MAFEKCKRFSSLPLGKPRNRKNQSCHCFARHPKEVFKNPNTAQPNLNNVLSLTRLSLSPPHHHHRSSTYTRKNYPRGLKF